jgi:hypothetical protein
MVDTSILTLASLPDLCVATIFGSDKVTITNSGCKNNSKH